MNKIEAIRKQLIFCQDIENYICGIYCEDKKGQLYYTETIQLLYPKLVNKIDSNSFMNCITITIKNNSKIRVFVTDIFNSRNSIVRNDGIIISEELFNKYETYQIIPNDKNINSEKVIIVKDSD